MEKIVVESVQEFRNLRNINENQKVNEGLFTSLKSDIDKFLTNPQEEKKANQLIAQSFAKQFAQNAKAKEFILKQPLDKKIEILKMAQAKLADPKVGILKLMKNAQGKVVVGGTAVKGGATQAISGK
jgi:hypothetical protein